MARKPRLHFPGAIYHVILQGNGDRQVVVDDIDSTRLLLLLQEGVEKFGHKIHAYCLLSHGLRLVVEVDKEPLSAIMQQLGFRYTSWFNARHGQRGHLFQGRYRAILIDSEKYLLALVRSLHLAPVARGTDGDPMRYPWSSHRAYCGREQVPWLSRDVVLAHIGESGIRTLMKFHSYVNEGVMLKDVTNFFTGSRDDPRILGDKDFVRLVMKLSRQKYQPQIGAERVVREVLERFKLSEDELAAPGKRRDCAQARAYLAWLYQYTGCDTLTNLSLRLGRDISSLSSAVRRLQIKAKKDEQAADHFQKLLKRLQR